MKLKISASCIWNVSKEDLDVAKDLENDEPGDVILDYLMDAQKKVDPELVEFEVSVEEV